MDLEEDWSTIIIEPNPYKDGNYTNIEEVIKDLYGKKT